MQSIDEWNLVTKELDLLDVDSFVWKVHDLAVRSPYMEKASNVQERQDYMKTTLGFEKHKNRFYDNFKVLAKRNLLRTLR